MRVICGYCRKDITDNDPLDNLLHVRGDCLD